LFRTLRGIHSSDCSLRPAAGYRNVSGDLRNVGTHGYALCSSPFAADGSLANRAGFLNFNSGNVNPITNAYRCEAFPVRCVQASAPKLFLLFSRYLWLALKILPPRECSNKFGIPLGLFVSLRSQRTTLLP
jgi:hypothetical protein